MASKSSNSSEEAISDINIVPLVDIILVVLIIFMVTVPASIKPTMDLNLPEASSSENKEVSPLNFYVAQDGSIYFKNTEVSEDEIKSISKEELTKNQEISAIVTADKNLAYGRVIQLLDWIKSAGIKSLSVTTEESL